MYQKQADEIFNERSELEAESERLGQQYVKLVGEYESNPTEQLKREIDDLDEQCEELRVQITDMEEKWINTSSVAMYYRDKANDAMDE